MILYLTVYFYPFFKNSFSIIIVYIIDSFPLFKKLRVCVRVRFVLLSVVYQICCCKRCAVYPFSSIIQDAASLFRLLCNNTSIYIFCFDLLYFHIHSFVLIFDNTSALFCVCRSKVDVQHTSAVALFNLGIDPSLLVCSASREACQHCGFISFSLYYNFLFRAYLLHCINNKFILYKK